MHDLDFSDFDTCVDCIKGKLTIRVRKNRATISEKVLQLIHTDIYGPITRVNLVGESLTWISCGCMYSCGCYSEI